ncbi:hypothetical protein ABEH28_27055 [Pseudomonas sp. Ps21-P2]|uniref:hypothetical protein n=1 Tax=Pseudomonas sp. Ps21-P2 TaxID=3080331 RepID=UPI0032085B06
MATQLTEEEMRQALFGSASGVAPEPAQPQRDQKEAPAVVIQPPARTAKQGASATLRPKLRVTLRVGNEYEGETQMFSYDADTLSTLQAELDATKTARKKFKYVELVSVTPFS